MEEMKFTHVVSKGSRYNQIYIPKEFGKNFDIGDSVEVRLIKKGNKIHYSKKVKLSRFKRKLIGEIFSFLLKYKEIKQIFIFGSFLVKNIEYNDIDIMIIVEKESEYLDRKIYEGLVEEFNLKFHVISVEREKLIRSLKIDPMSRSMLSLFVSNKGFEMPREREIDKNHIKYLLMFPEDLLKTPLDNALVYYNALRKLITIEGFLSGKDEDIIQINKKIKDDVGEKIFTEIQKEGIIGKKETEKLEEVISRRLSRIKRELK